MCRRQCILNCQKFIIIRRTLFSSTLQNRIRLLKPPQARFSSTHNESFFKKYNKLILPGIVFASAALGYTYFASRSDEEETLILQESKTVEKYVDPHLEENLTLLNEFGPVPYLIIGAGTAGQAAFRSIRASDPTSKIVIIGDEPYYPYMRPPLTKELWFTGDSDVTEKLAFKQWSGRERSLFFEREAFFCSVQDLLERKNGGVSVIRGLKVIRIDPSEQIVYLENMKTLSYKKCLLVPGGKPKNLKIFSNAGEDIKKHISTYKTVEDFKQLNHLTKKVKSITIIGGGFVGSELACALGSSLKNGGLEITQVFPEDGNMGQILPVYLSKWCTEKVRAEGITIIPNTVIKRFSKIEDKIKLRLSNGTDVLTDHIIVAIGSVPNIELANVSGLEIDEDNGGYLVNAEFEARKNLWVAGDAASFYDERLGRRRIEHHDHAIISGRLAGANMTGQGEPISQQSMFWSDLGPDIGYEAIGVIDSSLPTVGIFASNDKIVDSKNSGKVAEIDTKVSEELKDNKLDTPESNNFQKGVVFYLKNEAIVGILLWNVFGQMSIARKILNEITTVDNLKEVGKLFNFDIENENKL